MNKKLFPILIICASLSIVFGVLISILNIEQFGVVLKNDGYTSSLFSLAGIFLFAAALIYQIKELQLSVKAQTKSSEILEEQKQVLLEQNIHNLILGMINSFNDFRDKNNIRSINDNFAELYQRTLALIWQSNLEIPRLNHKDLNVRFANDIIKLFSSTILKHENFDLFKKYVHFAYNILFIIDENEKHIKSNYFTSFLHVQLSTNDSIMLSIANLEQSNLPVYENLNWGHQAVDNILNLVKSYPEQKIDFSDLDHKIIREELLRFIKMGNQI